MTKQLKNSTKNLFSAEAYESLKNLETASESWDACILGNGVSALWLAHLLGKKNLKVLWLRNGPIPTVSKAIFDNGWNWLTTNENKEWLISNLFQSVSGHVLEDEGKNKTVCFDAKSKRFKAQNETTYEWGLHEREFFKRLWELDGSTHSSVQDWHAALLNLAAPSVHVLKDIPATEINVVDDRIVSINAGVIHNQKPYQVTITADHFFLCDYDEGYFSLFAEEKHAKVVQQAFRFSGMHSGFGLEFQHGEFSQAVDQKVILPLTVNPADKKNASHIFGEFSRDFTSSYWIGFLTSEELEDNNEILKKMKTAKRAIDRAMPGFIDSIKKEQLFFQPKLWSSAEKSKGRAVTLGAHVLSDKAGINQCVKHLAQIDALDLVGKPQAANPEQEKRYDAFGATNGTTSGTTN